MHQQQAAAGMGSANAQQQHQPVNIQNVLTAGGGGGGQQNYSSTQYPSAQQNQSPFLDYQKFLEEEKLVFQNQKAKSHLGYYSVGPTPQNVLMQNMMSVQRVGQQTQQQQQSKSPDLLNSLQVKATHFKGSKHQNILGGPAISGSQGPMVAGSGISQSALASYSGVQNLLQQHSNRERQSQGSAQQTQQQQPLSNNSSSVTRPSSRKKGSQAAVTQSLIYDQSSGLYPAAQYMQKNASQGAPGGNYHQNLKAQSVLMHNKNDEMGIIGGQVAMINHNTLEALSKDQLNESSNYLSENDPLMKSNQQILNNQAAIKAQHQKHYQQQQQQQYPGGSMQDESYLDASVYEQFISGPHNISQFTGGLQLGALNNPHKILDEINSYQQYIQRPLSQNTIPNKTVTSKLGRQSPAQKNNTTRSVNAQMHSSQPKKAQRTASLINNSLNSSGQKQQIAHDRRLLVGRTPSPNFLKRIAGLMNIGNDFILPQQANMYKNVNGANLIVGAGQSKRSQSKQAFSSNPQSQIQQLQPHPHYPIQQNFIHIGPTNIQSVDKSLKQKFLKQQAAAAGALSAGLSTQLSNGSGSIMALGQGSRFKSGSLTTSANTAANSPRHHQNQQQQLDQNQQIIQRNQKTSQTTIKGGSVNSAYHTSATDFHSLTDALKKVGGGNPQQKLKMINELEERKALALVKGIKDYPQTSIVKQHQIQLQHHQQFLQQLHGGNAEEGNYNSSEYIEGGDSQDGMSNNYQNGNNKGKKGTKPGHKGNSKSISHTPNPNILGEGLLGGHDGMSTQQRQALAAAQAQAMFIINALNNNGDQQNMEQLRQGQKSQISHQHAAMSPITNKTASQFFKQAGQKNGPPLTIPMSHISGGAQSLAQQQLNIKPILQPQNYSQQPKKFVKGLSSELHDVSPQNMVYNQLNINQQKGSSVILNFDSNREHNNQGQHPQMVAQKKKGGMIEPPKITPPSADMFKRQTPHNQMGDEKSKKQQMIFQDMVGQKTPFDRELDQKANEIKKQKGSTAEQQKMQKYKEDSISILKQLQESGSIVIASDINPKEQSLHSKKGSVDSAALKQGQQPRLVVDMQGPDGQKRKGVINIQGPAAAALMDPRSLINSPKHQNPSAPIKPNQQLLVNSIDNRDGNGENDKILMTEEEEEQIKDVISDLNHKAFYGKVMKKTKDAVVFDPNDEYMRNLSPRSREIVFVKRIIKSSFEMTKQPPVTTTDFYRIGKMLGRGAFGKVNLAMHKLVRKLVAIKSLNKECLTDEAQKQKLMKEVGLLLKLRHNHVVKIYETIETEKHIIIVMELCAGGDLLNYVRKRRRLKEPYAKFIFKQIIDGLCYIHSKYIAHRDIKLDNILLDGKGNVKIGDFGVSKQCQKGQLRMTEQCGTPAYIAPEILKDKGYTFSVDLWSAGVVLFAMLYGTVPFKANNMEELHKLIVKGKYQLKDDISIEARNLLRGLLEVNPEKRLTIKQIYRHKWFTDLDPSLQLFNDQERDMIRKEYTYNDPRRYNRNENEEPVDCFTEHNLESVYNSLKNITSKSIILAPFNSTQSQILEEGQLRQSVSNLIQDKMMVLNFARRCREIDRQYEFNNNGELDNGVYHKFINNTEEQDDSGDENGNGDEEIDKDLLCIPMLMSSRKEPTSKGGKASVENSFEDDASASIKKLQERQVMALKIKEGSQIQKELHRNRRQLDNEIDPELVQTYEEYQTEYSSKLDQEKIKKLVQCGYPLEYVKKSLEENEPNYCTAGYYLLGMDQNYC